MFDLKIIKKGQNDMWFSNFTLYLEDYLLYENDSLG